MTNDKIIPNGEPLTSQELRKIAAFKQEDLNRAIALSHPSLKPYLQAK